MVQRPRPTETQKSPGTLWLGEVLRSPEPAGATGAKAQGYEDQVLNFTWGLFCPSTGRLFILHLEQEVRWVPPASGSGPLVPLASWLSPEGLRPRTEASADKWVWKGPEKGQSARCPGSRTMESPWCPWDCALGLVPLTVVPLSTGRWQGRKVGRGLQMRGAV